MAITAAIIIKGIVSLVGFIVTHRDEIKQLAKDVQSLIPDKGQGATRAGHLRRLIWAAIDVSDKAEAAYDAVQPFIDGIVKEAKGELRAQGSEEIDPPNGKVAGAA